MIWEEKAQSTIKNMKHSYVRKTNFFVRLLPITNNNNNQSLPKSYQIINVIIKCYLLFELVMYKSA